MKNKVIRPVKRKSIALINALVAFSLLITAMGAAFAVYSVVKDVSLTVLTSQVPGAVFGAIIAFLGIRYLLAVRKLRAEVFMTTAEFSFSNFRKAPRKASLKGK